MYPTFEGECNCIFELVYPDFPHATYSKQFCLFLVEDRKRLGRKLKCSMKWKIFSEVYFRQTFLVHKHQHLSNIYEMCLYNWLFIEDAF